MQKITSLLQKKLIYLDGAFGTELQKRGMPAGVCPELWCLAHPDILEGVHKDYVEAGVDIFFTCTFGGNPFKLGEYGEKDAYQVNLRLAQIARKAAGGSVRIAGDLAPTGRFIAPFGDTPFEDAVDAFKVQVKGLLAGGVDLFVIETMFDIQEARAALIAVKECCDLFTIVTMTYEQGDRTLNGNSPESVVVTLQSLGADAIGCNCSAGPREMLPLVERMQRVARVPLVAKPNAGMPVLKEGKTLFPMGPAEFAEHSAGLVKAGAAWIGGCCGTSPAHIRELIKATNSLLPPGRSETLQPALSSARGILEIRNNHPVYIIGERINPTGKKKLQEALKQKEYSYVQEMARVQEEQGADLLDVNAGVPGIDEKLILSELVSLLAVHSTLPLVIDSANVDAMAAALRLYPGRCLVNSINGEKERMEKLFPVAARYGAMLICLPLDDKGIPQTAEERIEVVQEVINTGKKYGFTEDDFVIDALVLAASSNPAGPNETLKTVRLCSKVMGLKTSIGLSNVSFGLPERQWINAAFLAMAAAHGLAFAIANPGSQEIMHIKTAGDLLLGVDAEAHQYIRHFTTGSSSPGKEPAENSPRESSNPHEKVKQGILAGIKDGIYPYIENSLAAGIAAQELIRDYMIPAITEVGDLYEKKVYFLPQLIAGAETMRKGFEKLKPLLETASSLSRGTIVAATVQGDIHDIGKNIVVLMMRNNGFNVIDLGRDIPAAVILEKALEHKADIILLSALMTTTMQRMQEVAEAARAKQLQCFIMTGGAVVTQEYADSIGCYYAKDSVSAVKLALSLVK